MGEKQTYWCFRCRDQFNVEMIKGPRGSGSIWNVDGKENKGPDPVCRTEECGGLLGAVQIWLSPRVK